MKNQNSAITFTLSVDEANKIFKALGGLPFNEVYELIGKMNEQANLQLSERVGDAPSLRQEASTQIDNIINN